MGSAKDIIELFGLKGTGIGSKIGLRPLSSFVDGDIWYSYFINEFLPEKGMGAMEAFVDLHMDPMCTILWLALKEGHLNDHPEKLEIEAFLEELKKRGEEVKKAGYANIVMGVVCLFFTVLCAMARGILWYHWISAPAALCLIFIGIHELMRKKI